jgi:acylphosphatase
MIDNKVFSITGEKIFDVGFRVALVTTADKYNIEAKAVNNNNEVQVIVSGSADNIQEFCTFIEKNDIRPIQQSDSPYYVHMPTVYTGPPVDYTHYREILMVEQLGKILHTAGNTLPPMKTTLDDVNDSIKDMNNDLGNALKDIGNTLKNIDKNTSKA